MIATKQRKCKVCKTPFTVWHSIKDKWCSPECLAADVANQRERKTLAERKVAFRKERAEHRAKKEAAKTRSTWIKEAQRAFNSYIRARDADMPCISCGALLGDNAIGGASDCGHYRSVGSAPQLRFDPDNAHAQCKKCNRYLGGRVVDYRVGLLERVGLAVVERLEADQSVKKWTIPDLVAIRDHYRAKTKALKAGVTDSATNVAKTATYKPSREEAYQLMGAAFQREGE